MEQLDAVIVTALVITNAVAQILNVASKITPMVGTPNKQGKERKRHASAAGAARRVTIPERV